MGLVELVDPYPELCTLDLGAGFDVGRATGLFEGYDLVFFVFFGAELTPGRTPGEGL